MASRRWLRGQSDVTVSLSAPRPLTTLGASRSMGPFDEVRRVYGDFATALPGGVSHSPSLSAFLSPSNPFLGGCAGPPDGPAQGSSGRARPLSAPGLPQAGSLSLRMAGGAASWRTSTAMPGAARLVR